MEAASVSITSISRCGTGWSVSASGPSYFAPSGKVTKTLPGAPADGRAREKIDTQFWNRQRAMQGRIGSATESAAADLVLEIVLSTNLSEIPLNQLIQKFFYKFVLQFPYGMHKRQR